MTTNLHVAPSLGMSGAVRLFPPTLKPALPKGAEELKQFWSFIQSLCVSRDSSVGIATHHGWAVRGSNPGRGEIFRTRPDRPWGPPNLLYNGYRIFPGGKTAGRDVDHPPHLAPRLKKE